MRLNFCPIRRTIPSIFIVLVAYFALSVSALAQLAEITPDQSMVTLDSELQYWAALGPTPGPAIEAYREGAFSDQPTSATHGIGHAPEMWFAVELRNESFDDGRAGDSFVIAYDTLTVVGYRLFLVREDGLTENLVDFSAFQPFSSDQWAVNRLRSPAFVLAPGEQVTLLAHLQLGPVPLSSVAVYRAESLADVSVSWASSMAAFYAFSLSVVILGFGFLVAMRSLYGIVYIILLFGVLAQLAFVDQLMFRFVMPDSPWLNRVAPNANLFIMALVICLVGSEGFRPDKTCRPLLSKIFLGLAGLSAVLLILTFVFENDLFVIASFGIIAMALSVCLFLPANIYQREDNPGFGIRWLFFSIALTLIFSMFWGFWGWGIGGSSVRLVFKLSYIVLLISVMTFFTGNLIALRLRHVSAVEARVSALELEAERSRQLLETERAYIRARETAAARQRQLATASHDIKQPLMSLRTTFDAIGADMDQGVRSRLRDAFSYLESLSKSYVDGTVPADETNESDAGEQAEVEGEAYSLSVPLNTAHQMFNGEAVSKGLRLRIVDSHLQTTAPPIVLMRILTNLVSNAIKYTDRGGVLVGVLRDGPTIWVCDTGHGMSAQEVEDFKKAYKKGATSTGHGLGLSVCLELAEANDMALTVTSTPGQGTVFQLSLAAHVTGTAQH